jgi:spore germination cell wall hydrolase CwlJ-like protein
MLQELKAVLINAQAEADPTNGATHYYAASMNPPPDWAATMTFVGQFGNQKFYRKGAALVA